MEIRVYDRLLRLQGITENHQSLVWTRRFFEPGEFKIVAPITPQNIALYSDGNIVHFKGATEAGIVENIILKKSHKESIMEISGRFLESYLTRRLTYATNNYRGLGSEIMHKIVNDHINIATASEPFYDGETQVETQTSLTVQCTFKEIASVLTKVGRATGNGYRVRPDFDQRKMFFDTYTGHDRSTTNTQGNAFVEFSDRFDNIREIETRYNTQLYKNHYIIGGEGQLPNRTYYYYFAPEVLHPGRDFSQRMGFLDASDTTSDGLTIDEYNQKLQDRGKQKAEEVKPSIVIEATVDPNGNFKYKRDYDLGDIVTIRESTLGINMNQRITEIMEVYEHEIAEIIPTFGDPLPTAIKPE